MRLLECGDRSRRFQKPQRELRLARWKAATAVAALQILLVVPVAFADDYDDGVAAVEAKNYAAAISAFRKAITQAPVETPTYLPHYWIGVAKFQSGDINGALQHWALSEAQGAIKKTPQYARMKDFIARAQAEKQQRAAAEPDAPKKAAEAAVSRAIAKQGEAIGARRDRTENYRTGQRKLQEASAEFSKGSYAAAQRLATEAADLFGGKSAIVPFDDDRTRVVERERTQVESAAKVEASIAVQNYRQRMLRQPTAVRNRETPAWQRLRREIDRAKSDADYTRIAEEAKQRETALLKKPEPEVVITTETIATTVPIAPVAPKKPNLEPAYRAYATGDLGSSEEQLTRIIEATPTAEAYLLRGCARYTKALLTRGKPDAAAADFREALERDRSLRLDQKSFSPKLVEFFEEIRAQR